MPDATHEEKLQATFEVWELVDAVWAIADRRVTEEEDERIVVDSARSATCKV